MTNNIVLITSRLRLREITREDWQEVYAYQSIPAYSAYYAWSKRTQSDAQNFVQMLYNWRFEKPRIKYQLAIELKNTRQLIGNCGIRKVSNRAVEAELGYEINPAYWSQGFATEAARSIITFGFKELGLHRIWASCLLENRASARVLQKLGMQQEGLLRENRHFKGRWWDTLIFAILAQESETH
jgi:RimJ/RimL family protein N-acetyltransferase